jgi:hypothetical protein
MIPFPNDCRFQVAFLAGVAQSEKVEDIRVLHDQVRRHALRILHRRQLLRDQYVELPRQDRAASGAASAVGGVADGSSNGTAVLPPGPFRRLVALAPQWK